MRLLMLLIFMLAPSCNDSTTPYDTDIFDDIIFDTDTSDDIIFDTDTSDEFLHDFTDHVDTAPDSSDISLVDNFAENDVEIQDTDTCLNSETDFCKDTGKCQNDRILLCSIKYEKNCPVGEMFAVNNNCTDSNMVCKLKDGTPTCVCPEEKWGVDGKCLDKITCPTYITTDDTIKPRNTVATFNALHLGWNNSKDFEALACIINHFDIVGLVEVETEEGLTELTENLEKLSGKNWDYHISDKDVGEGTYKEFYGFVWNTETVSMNSAVGFFPEVADEFKREPYAAEFTMGTFTFTFAVIHVVWGDSITERRGEVDHLDEVYNYFQGLDAVKNDIVIGGDFNLPVDDAAWTILTIDNMNHAIPATQLTTIGQTGLSSSYDNIFFSKYTDEAGVSGVLDFTKDNYSEIRKTVSDHIPVWIEIK